MWRLNEDGSVAKGGHLLLREGYFAPERLLRQGGMEPLFAGSIHQRAQEIDTKVGYQYDNSEKKTSSCITDVLLYFEFDYSFRLLGIIGSGLSLLLCICCLVRKESPATRVDMIMLTCVSDG